MWLVVYDFEYYISFTWVVGGLKKGILMRFFTIVILYVCSLGLINFFTARQEICAVLSGRYCLTWARE